MNIAVTAQIGRQTAKHATPEANYPISRRIIQKLTMKVIAELAPAPSGAFHAIEFGAENQARDQAPEERANSATRQGMAGPMQDTRRHCWRWSG